MDFKEEREAELQEKRFKERERKANYRAKLKKAPKNSRLKFMLEASLQKKRLYDRERMRE